ncbi:MAG: hypothetical protein HOP16_14760 [Acidobacteria bacterium]|nr:hypothetical protein [Acidobacteriota bacterium]
MTGASASAADYKTGSRAPKSGHEHGRTPAAHEVAWTGEGVRETPGKTAGPSTVQAFLKLLARSLQHFHTYPPTSPLCVAAVTACQSSLAAVPGIERLLFVVEPRDLRAGEARIGANTVIEFELARRLHSARVSTIEIDRAASIRDLSRFCEDVAAHRSVESALTLAEILAEHGVDRIVLTMAHRPEVLHIGAPSEERSQVLADERERRDSVSIVSGPSIHLYPPDTGWIRTDPGVDLGSVTLPDLAILVDDPTTLATMLLRLADDDPSGAAATPATALERKFNDVTKLFGALEPRLARVMFAKLAGAVLALDTNRRRRLLQTTVLPGLLDGEPGGNVLQDFPDVDLADALSLLLDVETAAPELLATALDRLALPDARRAAMAGLLEERVRAHLAERASGPGGDSALDERTRQLIRVSSGTSSSFEEFCAYDLAIDDGTAEAIARVGPAFLDTDLVSARLECALQLVQLEPSPVLVERLLRPVMEMLGELDRARRFDDVTALLMRLADLAKDLHSPRPDVADSIVSALAGYFDSARIGQLLAMYEADGSQRAAATAIVSAVGVGLATPFVERLKSVERPTLERSLMQLMSEHSAMLAPGLVKHVGEGIPAATAVVVRVLGFAGAGYEKAIESQLAHSDDAVVREAVRALARIGTAEAASVVGALVRQGGPKTQAPAEEALWHFPAEQAHAQMLELLQDRDFVMNQPASVARLLDRAGRAGDRALDPALTGLVPLRFRFWSPALRRVGARAHALLQHR